MKKFISLVLALVMALSLTTIAWGADVTVVDADSDDEIANALSTTTTAELVINLPATTGSEVFTIELYANYNAAIKSVTINGTDKTKVKFANLQVRLVDFDEFTINDCEILRMPNKSWGHLVFGGSKAGGVYTISDCLFTGVGTQGIYFNPESDAEWNVVGCTFTGDFGSEGAVVLQNNSKPTDLTVTNNDFDVAAGSEELTVHYHKEALTLNADVDETVLIWDAEDFEKAVATADAGDTFKLMGNLDLTATPVEITTPVTIDDNDKTLTGLAAGSNITTDANGKITGGTFETMPDESLLADDFALVQDTNGNWVAGTEFTMGDKYDLYLANAGMNTALTLKTPSVAGLTFEEVGAKTNKDGSGRVAYIAANNGQFFVKTSNPTVSDYAVTDAGKNTVLYYVTVAGTSAANFEYAEAVSAFTKFSTYAKCDYVTGTPVAGEDYFMAADGNVYMATAAGTGTNYLLNGKVVSGILIGAPEDHVFTLNGYKYDTTLKQNVPTSALCTKCMMNTSSIYPIAKVPATYTLYPTNGEGSNLYTVALPGAAAVVTPSTPAGDKVESAETFDAGIAMYVGMSIMAAAGSAVVLKKKD